MSDAAAKPIYPHDEQARKLLRQFYVGGGIISATEELIVSVIAPVLREIAELRRVVWLNHGHAKVPLALYGDDGELQCKVLPSTDFKRGTPDLIEWHLDAALTAQAERIATLETSIGNVARFLRESHGSTSVDGLSEDIGHAIDMLAALASAGKGGE